MVLERVETSSLRFSVVALASVTILAGCTLIGMGIGHHVDKEKAKSRPPQTLAGWQIVSVKRGSDVVLTLRDGRTLAGRFRGLQPGSDRAYVERYGADEGSTPPRPRLGPGTTLHLDNDKSVTGALVGLDLGAVWMREGSGEVRRRELDKVRELHDGGGHVFDSASLQSLTTSMSVPLLSEVVLEREKEQSRTPVDQVAQVSVPRSGHGTLYGALIGAAVDVAVVAVVATVAGSDPTYDSGGSSDWGSSCPLVSSFDGSRLVLDSETFGGALFRAAQRTDWDNLEHLVESEGVYRLRVSNEQPETQYLDELRLLVVDHPVGTRVIPDFSGGLHLLSGPAAPLVALDSAGHDATALVAADDDLPWLSSPFGRDPEDPSRIRDGLTLELPRPADVSRADLLVRVRNTAFGAWLQKQLLTLPGTGLESWYATMNTSSTAREQLRAAMIREGMLRVEVKTRGGWRDRGFVWEVGPMVWKDLVVPLDVSDVEGEPVQIRLTATAGLWLVDRVALEPGSVLIAGRAELLPTEARDEEGTDVRALLVSADGEHYAMPEAWNHADLVFAAPPPAEGQHRSVVLKSTGYYLVHVTPEGAPQLDVMERLVTEPGAYGRFALGLLHDEMRAARLAD